MKTLHKIFGLLIILGFASTQLVAQDKVREKDIAGKTWLLKIDIDDELQDEIDDADSAFERMIIKSVSGFVDGILDGIDIYFEFQDDNDLKITVDAFGDTEIEYTKWYINRDGALVIDDTDHFDADDEIWLFVDDVLVAFDKNWDGDLEDRSVYLVEIE